MAARRALVVDDSRSARAFLTRVLERHALAVNGVESAEEAIEYLTRQRPDVIFMDHLMPGMDGFQAVQAIKNNPHTATIPIMMYTSQEGELYLSQARALGAIGVLPKQIKHVDVTKALDQLRLLGDARSGARARAGPVPRQRPTTPSRRRIRRSNGAARRGHRRRLCRRICARASRRCSRTTCSSCGDSCVDSLESQAERIVGDMRLLLREHDPAADRRRPAAASAGQAAGVGLWLGLAGLLRPFCLVCSGRSSAARADRSACS